jgi:RNA polymerase sigma-70 factor, ECF subfamily
MTSDTAGQARSCEAMPSDRAMFEPFFRAEVARVLAVVLALRGRTVGAEDVAQEAFVRAYERWDTVGRMDRPDLWVQRVALNLATSRLRRLGAEARAVGRLQRRADRDVEGLRSPSLVDEPFWAAVRRLPDKQARVVALRYAGDLSIDEIATTVGVAPGTVHSQLVTARKRLASLLTDGDEDQP